MATVSAERKAVHAAARDRAKATYARLGITQEIERAVIEHLTELGAMQNCFVPGSSECNGDCPQGQGCIKTTTNNCVCSV